MRSGFRSENETTAEPLRRKFAEDAEAALQRAQAERNSPVEKTEAPVELTSPALTDETELWQEVRRELVRQNLFGPREYCRRMSRTVLVFVGLYVTYYAYYALFPEHYRSLPNNIAAPPFGNGPVPSAIVAVGQPSFLLAVIPIVFWAIAFFLYNQGAYSSALSDQKILLRPDGQTVPITETSVKAAAIVNRNQSRERSRWADCMFWLALGLALFFILGVPTLFGRW